MRSPMRVVATVVVAATMLGLALASPAAAVGTATLSRSQIVLGDSITISWTGVDTANNNMLTFWICPTNTYDTLVCGKAGPNIPSAPVNGSTTFTPTRPVDAFLGPDFDCDTCYVFVNEHLNGAGAAISSVLAGSYTFVEPKTASLDKSTIVLGDSITITWGGVETSSNNMVTFWICPTNTYDTLVCGKAAPNISSAPASGTTTFTPVRPVDAFFGPDFDCDTCYVFVNEHLNNGGAAIFSTLAGSYTYTTQQTTTTTTASTPTTTGATPTTAGGASTSTTQAAGGASASTTAGSQVGAGALARTGPARIELLATLALCLMSAGVVLAASGRRRRLAAVRR